MMGETDCVNNHVLGIRKDYKRATQKTLIRDPGCHVQRIGLQCIAL